MSDNLKLDEEGMREQTSQLKEAISDYTNFATSPFVEEVEFLSSMNTDFIAKYKTMLEDLNDSNPDVQESLGTIIEKAEAIVSTFEELDADTAQKMGFSQEG